MHTQVEESTPTTRKLKIDIPSSVIEEEIKRAYNKLRAGAKIPGFRVGKVPQAILEKKFSKDIETQVLEKIVPEFYSQVLKEAQISPINYPDIDGKLELTKTGSGPDQFQPLSFIITVEIKPEIKDINYEGIVLKEKTFNVEENEIESAVMALQTNKAVLKVTDGPIKEGDVAIITCNAFIAGKEINELQSKDYPFIVGSAAMPKEFSDALSGKKNGEKFEVKIKFEDKHPHKVIAGKDVLFKVLITEMKEKILPALDDEFAKEFNCSSLEELKKKLNENIHARKKVQIDNEYKKELMEHLLSRHDFEIPKSMIDREMAFQIDEAKQNALREGKQVKSDEELTKEYESKARKNVKSLLIFEAISKRDNIEVTENDLQKALHEIGLEHNLKIEEVKKLYIAKNGSLDGLKHMLQGGKVLDFILSKAVIEKDGS